MIEEKIKSTLLNELEQLNLNNSIKLKILKDMIMWDEEFEEKIEAKLSAFSCPHCQIENAIELIQGLMSYNYNNLYSDDITYYAKKVKKILNIIQEKLNNCEIKYE